MLLPDLKSADIRLDTFVSCVDRVLTESLPWAAKESVNALNDTVLPLLSTIDCGVDIATFWSPSNLQLPFAFSLIVSAFIDNSVAALMLLVPSKAVLSKFVPASNDISFSVIIDIFCCPCISIALADLPFTLPLTVMLPVNDEMCSSWLDSIDKVADDDNSAELSEIISSELCDNIVAL